MQRGRRAVYDSEAVAWEKPAIDAEEEYGRKVRMMTRSWRPLLDGSLARTNDSLFAAELVSHSVLRYGSGVLHIVLLGSTLSLVRKGRIYRLALLDQLGFLAFALAGRRRLPVPAAGLAYYYLLTTAATVESLVRYLREGSPATWAQGRGNALKTILFVGGGRHQRRAILRVRELGHRVVAVDRNPSALGLEAADVGEIVDFTDVEGVTEVGRRHHVDGVMTVAADRAVPVVAAVAEELGLPGIGTETAHRMTHKLLMRDAFARAGVPQPPFAALDSPGAVDAALAQVPLPAVLKPADSGGQRAVFRIESRTDLERDLADAIAESPTGVAILEEFVDGVEMNGIVVARARRAGAPHALGPAPAAGHRLRRRVDARLPALHGRRPAGPRAPGRGRRRSCARPARRDRVPPAHRRAATDVCPSSRSPPGSPAVRWPTSCATRSASTWSRSRFARP